MRINMAGLAQNNVIGTQKVMPGMVRTSEENRNAKLEKEERRDIATITPQGKSKSLLEGLMKQKMEVVDNKNALIASTIEKGKPMESIKTQIEAYDAQLKNIDDQISSVMLGELEKTEEKQGQINNEPKTKEEIQNKRLADVTNVSLDLEQMEAASSLKAKIDGDIEVLKSEISMDSGRSSTSVNMAEKKQEKLSELETSAANLAATIGAQIAELSDKSSEINKVEEEEPDKTLEADKTKEETMAEPQSY